MGEQRDVVPGVLGQSAERHEVHAAACSAGQEEQHWHRHLVLELAADRDRNYQERDAGQDCGTEVAEDLSTPIPTTERSSTV